LMELFLGLCFRLRFGPAVLRPLMRMRSHLSRNAEFFG